MATTKPRAFGVTEEEFIFHTANDFFITGLSKMNKLKRPMLRPSTVYIWELACPFTNISFAIELLFKSFLNRHINTHSLLLLYNSIDTIIQRDIENNFEKIQYNL